MSSKTIRVVGAREHNLKNITLEVPRDQLIVMTGLSGSGKSSLASTAFHASQAPKTATESLSQKSRYCITASRALVSATGSLVWSLAISEGMTSRAGATIAARRRPARATRVTASVFLGEGPIHRRSLGRGEHSWGPGTSIASTGRDQGRKPLRLAIDLGGGDPYARETACPHSR